jgi:hypothetical protein
VSARATRALRAGVSEADLKFMEANDASPPGAQPVRDALEQFGVVFIPENGGGAGVRLKFNRSEVKQIGRLEGEGGPAADDDV